MFSSKGLGSILAGKVTQVKNDLNVFKSLIFLYDADIIDNDNNNKIRNS